MFFVSLCPGWAHSGVRFADPELGPQIRTHYGGFAMRPIFQSVFVIGICAGNDRADVQGSELRGCGKGPGFVLSIVTHWIE